MTFGTKSRCFGAIWEKAAGYWRIVSTAHKYSRWDDDGRLKSPIVAGKQWYHISLEQYSHLMPHHLNYLQMSGAFMWTAPIRGGYDNTRLWRSLHRTFNGIVSGDSVQWHNIRSNRPKRQWSRFGLFVRHTGVHIQRVDNPCIATTLRTSRSASNNTVVFTLPAPH